jgi:2Fe-2S ferredoxin
MVAPLPRGNERTQCRSRCVPHVTFRLSSGEGHTIDIPAGWSVMEGAVRNGIAGILAECGGSCSCATCHVYVDPEWLDRLSPPSEMERDLLGCTAEPAAENSRLACQLRLVAELDGISLRVPERQG